MAYVMHAFPPEGKAGVVTEGIISRGRWYGCTIRPVKAKRRIPMSTLTLNKHDIAVAEDATFTPEVTIWPENANNKTLKWESEDPDVVSVDKEGKVTAHKSGYTTVWCRHGALWDTFRIEVAPFGYGIYLKNELDWDKTFLVARIIDHNNFTGNPGLEPADERDGYLYFPLDESMMDQELIYSFTNGKGAKTGEFRKASYEKRIIYKTLTK